MTGVVLAGWAITRMLTAYGKADRLEDNLHRAQAAVQTLERIVPAHMPADAVRIVRERVEDGLKNAAAADDVIPSGNVETRSLGVLPGVLTFRQQARLQLRGLTLQQVAVALDAAEGLAPTCWIESVEVAAVGDAPSCWSATIDVNWFSKVADPAKK